MAEQQQDGVPLIKAERIRQVQQEGWTPEHDAQHQHGELMKAALSYLFFALAQSKGQEYFAIPLHWPWEPSWWKPSSDPVRNLVKAGALVAAEIDRLNKCKGTSNRHSDTENPSVEELQARLQRMTDLVRYKRLELLDDGLITIEEYGDLAQDNAAVARLDAYDELWRKLAEEQAAHLETQKALQDAETVRADLKHWFRVLEAHSR